MLIRDFDAESGWSGCLSCAQWLSWRTGLAPGPAREHVRVARALGELPKLSDAMRRGRISYSKVRAVTRVATPANEQRLLDVALAGTAEHVEQIARSWRRVDRAAEQAEEQRQDRSRSLRTWVDVDGMVVVRGRLTPEVGAVLRRALEAGCDEARRKLSAEGDGATAGDGDAAGSADGAEEPTLAQRQADAIGMVAEAALAGGLDRGTAGDRYQVVLHVDAEALTEPRDVPAGTSAGAAAGPGQQNPGRCAPAEMSAGVVGPGREMPGGYVPAGTPDGDAGRSGAEPRRDGRRWRRTNGPCPGARPAPAASGASRPRAALPDGSQTVLDEAGGIHVSAETARRVACDAAAVTMRHAPAVRFSTSAGARAPCHPRCAVPWPPAIDGVASPAAGTAAAMPITSSTGPTAAGRRSTTSCCSAGRHDDPLTH